MIHFTKMNDDQLMVEMQQLERLHTIGMQCIEEEEGFKDSESLDWVDQIHDQLCEVKNEMWKRIVI